jgi:hypothetical protein
VERPVSLIDRYIPRFDASEHHAIVIRATPERVYAALRTADFGGGVTRLFMRIRTWGRWAPSAKRLTLDALLQTFALVDENAPHEIVLGLQGPFWKPVCIPRKATAEDFHNPPPLHSAIAAWNFAVEPLDDGRTRLSTETRILCGDPASRRKFKLYWIAIRLGSGAIRKHMLRRVRKEAEKT